METLNIKPNYSELARIYECDRRTVKKYNDGYTKENTKRKKPSKLDEYKENIKSKLELPGATINGTYQYFKKNNDIGTYSNFYKYVKKDESANRFMSWLIPYKMGFKMWAMRNIDMVKVKKPLSLRKEMQDILKSAINKYELKD
mgnify:CR=1 FL=1